MIRSPIGSRWMIVAVLLLLAGLARESLAESSWRVGVARVNITPEQPLWMAGYGSRTHEATGKISDLYVRACALEDSEGQRALLVSLDLIGMDRTLAQSICQALERRCGLPRSRVALCFSHTHSGPVVGKGLAPLHYLQLDRAQQNRIDDYTLVLREQIVECVERAIGDLSSVELMWGSGTTEFAVNRRNNVEAKVPELRASGQLRGPSDHAVPVLAARNPDGTWKSLWFGYACHATTLDSYMWCGDYPGFAAQELEERYPACVALFWAGCGADQNPLPRRQLELAQHYGRQLAEAVAGVLADGGGSQSVPAKLSTGYVEVSLPLSQIPDQDELHQAAQSQDRFVRARAEMYLEQLAAGRAVPTAYPFPVQVWKLGGQVQCIFLGGEVVVDYAIRLKSELAADRTWVAGYANDVMAYIPSQRVLAEGGYEGKDAMVYYGLPSAWSPQVEQLIVDAVHELIRSTDAQQAIDGGKPIDGGTGEDPHVLERVRLP
ncbi:MAG: neutral/alkaline non-lysosomal ceramidase N-terminal domain-containing protein [Pirellulaceae bacterium]